MGQIYLQITLNYSKCGLVDFMGNRCMNHYDYKFFEIGFIKEMDMWFYSMDCAGSYSGALGCLTNIL